MPIRRSFSDCLSEPRIRIFDGYIMVDAEPDFKDCDFRALDADVESNDASRVIDR